MDRLNKFGSWRISKCKQPLEKTVEDSYECSIKLSNGEWDTHWNNVGSTIEKAIDHALESPNKKLFCLSKF